MIHQMRRESGSFSCNIINCRIKRDLRKLNFNEDALNRISESPKTCTCYIG